MQECESLSPKQRGKLYFGLYMNLIHYNPQSRKDINTFLRPYREANVLDEKNMEHVTQNYLCRRRQPDADLRFKDTIKRYFQPKKQ